MEIVDDGAYIMFTRTVYRFHGFTFMLMQRHNEVQCQSHDTGMARISEGGVRSQSCAKGHIMDGIRAFRHAFYENHTREYQS